MSGKVFISCGQANPKEREIANELESLLKAKDFNPFLAFREHGLEDLNKEIIKNLENSDYFVFVDFQRERIRGFIKRAYRGSLFSNQELALSYYMGFIKDETIFLQHSQIELDGMNRYILFNPIKFNSHKDVPRLLEEKVHQMSWSPSYSRQLVLNENIGRPVGVGYKDHLSVSPIGQWVWFVYLTNKRKIPARDTVTQLINVKGPNVKNPCPDRAALKWAGAALYQRLIMPGETAHFDALAINADNSLNVYLHSLADLYPRPPIISGQSGIYVLRYQVISENFPLLEFDLELKLTNDISTTEVRLLKPV